MLTEVEVCRNALRVALPACMAALAVACRPAAPVLESAPSPATEVRVPPATPESTPPLAAQQQPAACDDSERSFKEAWRRLRRQLETGAEGLAPLLDAHHGMFVVDNPGAYTVPMHFGSYDAAAEAVPRLRPEHYRFTCAELVTGSRPTFSCEEERWSQDGCLHTVEPEFSVARWYELGLEYDFLEASVVDEELPRARRTDALIRHGVYSTAEAIGFYFGQLDCEWRLLAIDTVTPCSA